ncbi:ribosome maturation factor [Lachnospiraceae bacterium]|nr:ribosome maturation factor [Lachnospiraceae bacterium]
MTRRLRAGFPVGELCNTHSSLPNRHGVRDIATEQEKRAGGTGLKKHEDYVRRTEEFLTELQKALPFELVDVEFVKEAGTWYLRAYCDMEGGIGVDDCAEISRRLSDWLDQEDFIPENYILEVSSPGLGRQLKKDKDLLREIGKKVEGKYYRAVDGNKEFCGILKDFDASTLTLETDGAEQVLERSNLAMLRLMIDF